MKNERIMIVEDDRVAAEHLRTSLKDWGYPVETVVQDGETAIREAELHKPHLILMDVRLKGAMDGIAAAETLSSRFHVPVVFLSAHEEEALVEQARMAGAFGYLLKPFDDRILKITVETALYRHKMEKTLQESEKRYRGIIEGMAEGYYEVDLEGNFTFINEAMAQIVGIPKAQLQGANNRDFMAAETAEVVYRKYNDVYQTGIPVKRFEYELKTKEGRARHLEVSIALTKDSEGRPTGFRGVARDITEKRKMEIQLLKTRNFLQNILNSSLDGISTTDMKGRIVYATPRLREMLGFDQKELLGNPVYRFYKNGKADAKYIMEILTQKGDLKNYEMQFVGKDGKLLEIMLSATLLKDESGKAIGTVGVFKDISEKKRMEEQILHVQKLESVGVLAGGIAHDFNNILTAIVGNISLAKMYAKTEGKLVQILTEAERASGRAKELTERLLNFSRAEKPVKRVDAVGRLMQDVTALVLSGSNVCYEFDVPPDLWMAEYNPNQIRQALTNVVLNAMEAMPKGGVVRASAKNVVFDRKRVDLTETIPAGKYVQLTIADHGAGIQPADLPKIFDPYFSTKEQGLQKGMGLGLTTVYSIVKRHEGYLHVESELGSGTKVHLFLPAYESVQREPAEVLELGETRDRPKGKILVMDDEEIVREVVGEMLKEMGYAVKYAKDGSEAIELYQKAKGAGAPFEAVILDVTVKAGMGGKDTMKRLLEVDPGVRAFVSSGYSDEPIIMEHQKYGFVGAIAKPFNVETLREKLEQRA